MSCQHCVAAVIRGLNNNGGLKEEKADLGKGEAFASGAQRPNPQTDKKTFPFPLD